MEKYKGGVIMNVVHPKESTKADLLKLFSRAMVQVCLVAMNVTFIADKRIALMLITGFIISLMWTLNVKSVTFGGWTERFTYAFGAMVGTGLGYLISTNI